MSDTTPSFHTRRSFLRTTILGGALSWTVPLFLERTFQMLGTSAASAATQVMTGKDTRILVLLQLAGGNDGLNTVVPYADDAYFKARPQIHVPASKVLRLTDDIGFHPSLRSMRTLYDEGCLGLIQGVGYPNPNRSHFRSMEIWATGSDSDRVIQEGWIGRYFDSCCEGAQPTEGISLTRELPQIFASPTPKVVSFANPEEFRTDESLAWDGDERMDGNSIGALSGGMTMISSEENHAEFLRRTALDAQVSADQIQRILKNTKHKGEYPGTRLGQSLRTVARLIAGGMTTRVYYVSHGGFDTHANQTGTHERLLKELDEAMAAFARDLRAQGNFERVLLMTFSEFGRRVKENASGGTDHGAAAPLFVLGGDVKAGIHGKHPSLVNLRNGDLVHETDFRSVYATVLERWLGVKSEPVLHRKFPVLGFV